MEIFNFLLTLLEAQLEDIPGYDNMVNTYLDGDSGSFYTVILVLTIPTLFSSLFYLINKSKNISSHLNWWLFLILSAILIYGIHWILFDQSGTLDIDAFDFKDIFLYLIHFINLFIWEFLIYTLTSLIFVKNIKLTTFALNTPMWLSKFKSRKNK